MAVHSKLILMHLLRGREGDSLVGRACDFSSGDNGFDLRPGRLPSIGCAGDQLRQKLWSSRSISGVM